MTSFETRLDEACAWAAQLSSDDADWEAFTLWLEADAENVRAYDVVAALEGDIEAQAGAIQAALPSNDTPPVRRRRWLPFAGAAVAASLAALIAVPAMQNGAPEATTYDTAATAGRTLALDGAHVRLDTRTRITVSKDRRHFELASGAAYFDVKHDPEHPLVVTAGGYDVRDIGTRFEVSSTPDHLSVSVAEGQVEVAAPGAAATPLIAGRRLDISLSQRQAEQAVVDPADIGAWRSGQLRYQDAPLSLVVNDVNRYSKRRVTVDPSAADLRFSGVIEIGDGSRLVERVQQLLPVEAKMVGSTTHLLPRGAR